MTKTTCFESITCQLPDEPAFDILRREAQECLGAWSRPRSPNAAALVIDVRAPAAGAGDEYVLERQAKPGVTVMTVRATGTPGAAHGFHHVLRLLGFGFSFFADAIPAVLRLDWPAAGNRLAVRPRFARRGLFACHNLLNSPTVWNLADYQRYYRTLWRWGGNCVMYHHYDHEPLAAFRERNGTWRWGKPFSTTLNNRWGAAQGIKTGAFAHGTGRYFRDAVKGAWGAASCSAADPIASAQAEFAQATAFARSLGIKVVFGFEMLGEPTHRQYPGLLRRRIQHVLETYPDLDTLCFWQQEGRGVTGWLSYRASPGFAAQEKKFGRHFRYLLPATHRYVEAIRIAGMFDLACRMARAIKPDVRLVVSGWGGDYWFRWGDYWRGLDRILPAPVAFAAFDNLDPHIQLGVSSAIKTVRAQRPVWVIPWLESDGGSLGRSSHWHPQEDLALMEKLVDSAAALGYRGCLGLHWQTAGVELSASHLLAATWDRRLTARDHRCRYAATFFDRSPRIARQIADWLEELESQGPGWTGTGQQIECSGFRWNPHPPLGTGPLPPSLARLGKRLWASLQEATRLPEFKYPTMGPLTELPFQFAAHRAKPGSVARLQQVRDQFARLGLTTPHARRWLATMDFVLAYERIKSSLELDGRLFALHDLLLNQKLSDLKLDAVTLRAARAEIRGIERAWKQVFAAQIARLDTRGDLGNLANLNLKAWPAWATFLKEFRSLQEPRKP